MPTLRILIALVIALLQGGGAADAPPSGLREEYFVLELVAPAGDGARATAQFAGLAMWRRRSDPAGEQCEWELRFRDDPTRIQQVESARGGRRRLVWREWRPGAGRTLLADRVDGSGEFGLVEWGRSQSLRMRLAGEPGARMPLELLELARHGELGPGECEVFDPLSRSVERLQVAVQCSGVAAGGGSEAFLVERTFELTRADGTSAGSYRFRGDELVAYRPQNGALVARRVEAAEHAQRLADLTGSADADLGR